MPTPNTVRVLLLLLCVTSTAVAGGKRLASSLWHPHGDPDTALHFYHLDFPSRTDPWVQQMRNIRDVLLVDAFRARPTPAPSATPPATSQAVASNQGDSVVFTIPNPASFVTQTDAETFDRTPPHPLRNYFSDVAGIYTKHGYKELGRSLHGAGMIVENLLTRTGKNRVRAARNLARKVELGVSRSTDEGLISQVLNWPRFLPVMSYNQPPVVSSYYWGDYRLAAAYFAKGLRAAAKNAAAGRPLTRRIPYVPENLLITLTLTRSWNSSTRVDMRREDGFGGFLTQNLYDPNTGSGGSATYTSASVSFTAAGPLVLGNVGNSFLTSGRIDHSAETTPTPSPTP